MESFCIIDEERYLLLPPVAEVMRSQMFKDSDFKLGSKTFQFKREAKGSFQLVLKLQDAEERNNRLMLHFVKADLVT